MMRVVVRYSQRLGDIIRCLPICRHWAAQGWEAFVECKPCYWGIFDAVSYAKPVWPARAMFDLDFPLEIWPTRYQDFRDSGKPWMDYVYGLFPELAAVNRTVVFDRIDEAPDPVERYGLRPGYCILSCFGYSQAERVALGRYAEVAGRHMPEGRTVLLCDQQYRQRLLSIGVPPPSLLTAESLGHLPRIIRDAAQVMTTNSAPAHIAAAVRSSYFHIPEGDRQNDLVAPNQIRITL